MKLNYKYPLTFLGIVLFLISGVIAQDGQTLFKQNCAACHKLGKRLVGPDLIGVNERRKEDWLLKFIKSSQSLINSGDADAKAIYEEFDQMIMTDQTHLSDDDVKTILSYIKEQSPSSKQATSGSVPAAVEEEIAIVYSEGDVAAGFDLFSGKQSFTKGGQSCLSCHNVNNDAMITGGALAKDLTNVYGRMGDAGIAGILGSPPFPAMSSAYKSNALDSTEISQLTAFLKHVDSVASTQKAKNGYEIFLFGGGAGVVLLFIIISLLWNRRLRKTVKDDIYSRQLKSI